MLLRDQMDRAYRRSSGSPRRGSECVSRLQGPNISFRTTSDPVTSLPWSFGCSRRSGHLVDSAKTEEAGQHSGCTDPQRQAPRPHGERRLTTGSTTCRFCIKTTIGFIPLWLALDRSLARRTLGSSKISFGPAKGCCQHKIAGALTWSHSRANPQRLDALVAAFVSELV